MQVKSPPAPLPGVAQPVPVGDPEVPELLFEHSGWGLYSRPGGKNGTEANALTHIGCDCEFPNWHLAVYIWADYKQNHAIRAGDVFRCQECDEVLPVEAYEFFKKAYNLVNLT